MRENHPQDPWLAVLEGRAVATDPAGRQAAELRGYFEQRLNPAAEPADAEQEKRLMNLLRARGAFSASVAAPATRPRLGGLRAWWQAPQGHRGLGYGAAAMLAFAVIVGPQLLSGDGAVDEGMKNIPMQPQPKVVQPKGLDLGTSTIKTAQPEQEALRLQLQLSAQGLASELLREGQGWVLRAQVPPALRGPVQGLLDGQGATLPADGQLKLRFER